MEGRPSLRTSVRSALPGYRRPGVCELGARGDFGLWGLSPPSFSASSQAIRLLLATTRLLGQLCLIPALSLS
jgi:hypothetical protein